MPVTNTRTIVQTLDSEGNVTQETVTTVSTWQPEPDPSEQYGLYL